MFKEYWQLLKEDNSTPIAQVSDLEFIDNIINKLGSERFINVIKELTIKDNISWEEWDTLVRLRSGLIKIEISPEHLPEWRKYV